MKQLLTILICLCFLSRGVCQTGPHSYDWAVDKLVNRSWIPEKACWDGDCKKVNGASEIIYFKSHDLSWFDVKKYKTRLAYSAVSEHIYSVDTITGQVRPYQGTDHGGMMFIDSNSNKKNSYFVMNWSPLDDNENIVSSNEINTISFLSDSEMVASYKVAGQFRQVYFGLYKTPRDFYQLYGIKPE